MRKETLMCKGLVERIGMEGSVLTQEKIGVDEKKVIETPIADHKVAMKQVIAALLDQDYGVLKDLEEVGAVGHRVVHAGERYSESVLIDNSVIEVLKECIELAPLHNPPNLLGINACRELMPNVPMVAVFDTAFHQTMPPESYIYAIPYKYYDKYRIRRYGFHGTSHKYVAERAAILLGVSLYDLKLITCHLGNGASVSAIKRGRCIDTSMGFTPLSGLAMGTRSGSVDPAIIQFVAEKEKKTMEEVLDILNKESGMLGVSGVSSDFRDLDEEVQNGNVRAELALKVFAHRVRYYIGAYYLEMNGLDGIVFTAGVGENDTTMREIICNELGNLGIKLDLVKNKVRGREAIISRDDSRVSIMMIPTNEELMIARDTYNIARNMGFDPAK
jgi:acetate kinase